jgi:AraC-like DNA-binding protein
MNYFYENRIHLLDDNMPLSIYVNDNFSYRAHWHTEFELAYVESGTTYICINNDRRKLCEGDFAICSSGDIHYFDNADATSRIILLVFKPEFFGFSADWPGALKFSPFVHKGDISPMELEKIRNPLYSILKEKGEKQDYYELFIKGIVTELCALLLRHLPKFDLNKQKLNISYSKLRTLQDILVYIDNNFTEDIALKSLADTFNMDPFNLSKCFNSLTGTNFKTYINTLRVSRAEDMILSSDKPLTHIAMECGFNSIRTFNRVYKEIKGYVPSSRR